MDALYCCWVVAARRLPRISVQIIIAKTVFGLAYGFVFEGRLPSPAGIS
jgi:hypothetical protein